MKHVLFTVRKRAQTAICLSSGVCVCVHTRAHLQCFLSTGLLHVVSNSESSRWESTLPSWLAIAESCAVHVPKLLPKCCLALLHLWYVPASNMSLCGRQSQAQEGVCPLHNQGGAWGRLPEAGSHVEEMKGPGPVWSLCSRNHLLDCQHSFSTFL